MKDDLLSFCCALTIVFTLVACSDVPESGLQEWMSEQRSSLKPVSEVVAVPKKFNPQVYTQEGNVDPFGIQKLVVGLKSEPSNSVSSSGLIAAELNRRKQSLESYPLDVMAYVGSMEKGSKKSALLRVDKLIYQVEQGTYLGPNYGKIIKVSETEIVLREIVQDAAGEWIERQATLQLQETK